MKLIYLIIRQLAKKIEKSLCIICIYVKRLYIYIIIKTNDMKNTIKIGQKVKISWDGKTVKDGIFTVIKINKDNNWLLVKRGNRESIDCNLEHIFKLV